MTATPGETEGKAERGERVWPDRPFRCPTCDSAFPELVAAGGCDDRWHEPEPRTVPQWRSEVERWAGILEQFSYAKNPVDAASRLAADMRRELAAQPPAPADEGKAESGERIPGRDYCPLDGEPLGRVIQAKGQPTLYIHADRLTWHTDATDKIRAAAWEYPFTAEAPGSPEAMLREIFAAQPPAPADDTAPGRRSELDVITGAWGVLGRLVGEVAAELGLPPEADGEDILDEIRRLRVSQPAAPADDTAAVLAGLRTELAALLRKVAAGRREYAVNAPEHYAEILRTEANAFKNAARIVEGDESMVRALLPSWRWPEAAQQRLADRGQGGGEG